jgi:hypothetical protein
MDTRFERFVLMRQMGVPDDKVRLKMMTKGFSNYEIDLFFRESLTGKEVLNSVLHASAGEKEKQVLTPKGSNLMVPSKAVIVDNSIVDIPLAPPKPNRSQNHQPVLSPKNSITQSKSNFSTDPTSQSRIHIKPEVSPSPSSKGTDSKRTSPRAVSSSTIDLDKFTTFVKNLRASLPEAAIRENLQLTGLSPEEIDHIINAADAKEVILQKPPRVPKKPVPSLTLEHSAYIAEKSDTQSSERADDHTELPIYSNSSSRKGMPRSPNNRSSRSFRSSAQVRNFALLCFSFT